MKGLTKRQLGKLQKLDNGWKLTAKDTKLAKTFTFEKHIDALIFIARVTVNAEIIKHYPEIRFTERTAKMTLTTSELKGLSQKDLVLMARIERLSTTPEKDSAVE